MGNKLMPGIITGIFLLTIIPLSPAVESQTDSPGTCGVEQVTHNLLDVLRIHRVIFGSGGGCNIYDADAGAKITFRCSEESGGAGGPTAPQATFVYAYNDNVQFGSPGAATPLWTFNIANCGSLASPTTFDKYCTIDGNSGSAKYFGGVRIVIRAQRTTIPTYDIDSDDGGTPQVGASVQVNNNAVVRCNPHVTLFEDENTASSPIVYIGGDTLRSKLQVNSTYGANQPTNPVLPQLVCSTFTANGAAITPTTTTVNTDYVIKGRTNYPDDCTLIQKYTITTFFTTTGFTTTSNFIWSTTNLLSGQTVTSDLVTQRNAKILDRTLTKSGTCTTKISGIDIIIANRFETIDSNQCGWRNARNNAPPNNALGIAYMNLFSGSLTSTTDIPSANAQFSNPSGNIPSSHQIRTTATVTTGEQYRRVVEEFGSARTDAELYNWGSNCLALPCDFDVSATYNDDNIVTSKSPSGSPQTRTFTTGDDTMYFFVDKLQNIRGTALNGISLSCERKKPDGSSESTTSMGTTNANGDTSIKELPVVPPLETWTLTCTGSSNGNSYSHTIEIVHVSTFSGNVDWGIAISSIELDDVNIILNITANPKIFDPEVDKPITLIPDGTVKTTIYVWDEIDTRYEPLYERVLMDETNAAVIHKSFLVEKEILFADASKPILVAVYGNLSTNPIMNTRYHNYVPSLEVIKAEVNMNPFLLGLMIMLIGYAINFFKTDNPIKYVVAIMTYLVGGFYSFDNLDKAFTFGMYLAGLLWFGCMMYTIFAILHNSNGDEDKTGVEA